MNTLIDRLRRGGARPLLWDGGMGTALISRGLELDREPPEAWLLTRPDEVRAVHAEFAAAGADVLQTNSFGLLRHMILAKHSWDFRELASKSVALAEAGARSRTGGEPAAVVASIGPVGLGASAV